MTQPLPFSSVEKGSKCDMHKWLTDVSTHKHFNPLFPMKTLHPLDTSTCDIKTFQPLPIQTFQAMFWTLIYFYVRFRPLFLNQVNPYIEGILTLVKPIFTSNTYDNCPIKHVFTVSTLCYVGLNVLDNYVCSPNEEINNVARSAVASDYR